MSEPLNGQPPLDMKRFLQNRREATLEEQAKYAGKHVAYSGDGTSILASGDTLDELEEALAAAGYDPNHVVFSYILPPGVTLL